MANTTFCFNCETYTNHIARNCNLKQRYTRCNVCDGVCFQETGHHNDCTNKDFRSDFIVEKVQQTTMALEFWCSQELTHILDGSTLKPLSSAPVILSGAKVVLQKFGLTVKLFHFDTDGIIRLSVADSDGVNRFRIFTDPQKFIVNDRIRVTADGAISVRNIEKQLEQADIHMICANVDAFEVQILKFGSFGFLVGRSSVEIDIDASDSINGTSVNLFDLFLFILYFNTFFRSYFQSHTMIQSRLTNVQLMAMMRSRTNAQFMTF